MRRIALIAGGVVTLLVLFQLPILLPRLGDGLISSSPAEHLSLPECPDDMILIPNGPGGFCIDRFEAPNVEGDQPLTGLGLQQALEYCAAKGRRLCTEGEWYRACVGPDGGASYLADCVNPNLEPAALGERTVCRSPEGVADLSGNVLEWTSDGQQPPQAYFLKGGSYLTPDGYTSCGYQVVILPGQDDFSRPDLGVRCCM